MKLRLQVKETLQIDHFAAHKSLKLISILLNVSFGNTRITIAYIQPCMIVYNICVPVV